MFSKKCLQPSSMYLILLFAFATSSLAAQCGGPWAGSPSPIEDTQVWQLRAQVCNAPSCPTGQICSKTFHANWDEGTSERVNGGDITVSYYSQTGSFSQCWTAFGDIISQCNRNGWMFGEWDFNGEAYWISNTIDKNQHTLTNTLGGLATGISNFPLSQGTWLPSYSCVGGTITGGTETRNWNWSTGTSYTIGGSINFSNILGDLLKQITGIAGGISGGKTWSEQTGGSVSDACTAANGQCIQPEGRQHMGYSFGFTVGTDWIPASGPSSPTIRTVTITPYHLDAPLTESDGKTPVIDWNCSGACPRGTFNPQCASVPSNSRLITSNALVQQSAHQAIVGQQWN